MNPDNLKNLALKDKEWKEAVDPDYLVENKDTVRDQEAEVKEAKKAIAEFEEPEPPFKMARFKDVEPQIKAKELESTIADQHQQAENAEH